MSQLNTTPLNTTLILAALFMPCMGQWWRLESHILSKLTIMLKNQCIPCLVNGGVLKDMKHTHQAYANFKESMMIVSAECRLLLECLKFH